MRLILLYIIALLHIAFPLHAKTLFTSWDQLTLIGGFKVPSSTEVGTNSKYTSGAFDKLPGTKSNGDIAWIANLHDSQGYVIEYIEPSGGPTTSFPELKVGRYDEVSETSLPYGPTGVQWIDENNLIASSRKSYRSSPGATWNWIALHNLETGVTTALEVGHVDDSTDWEEGSLDNKLWATHQSFGAGFVRIPSTWASSYTGGRTIGLGRGGYDTSGSPFGPSLAAFAITDTYPTVLLNYPYSALASDGNSHWEIRDKNYQIAKSGNREQLPLGHWMNAPGMAKISDVPLLYGPTGDNGWMMTDNVSSGAGWIDDTTYKGIVYGVTTPVGTLDYTAQGDEGTGDVGFLVYDTSAFYDGDPPEAYPDCDDSSNRGCHSANTEYANFPDGQYQRNLYVYDPDCLAQVASGALNEWECSPTIINADFSDLPYTVKDSSANATHIKGVTWDADRGYLWLLLTNMHTNNNYPLLVAYQLGKTRPTIFDIK